MLLLLIPAVLFGFFLFGHLKGWTKDNFDNPVGFFMILTGIEVLLYLVIAQEMVA